MIHAVTTTQSLELLINSENDMLAFGKNLAETISPGNTIYLHGELGVGKTTLARGLLRACGHTGAVKSPTYALVETYELKKYCIYHFDLYRLTDAEELEYMGVRDYFQQSAICLVEWAENGAECLPEADLNIRLRYQNVEQRQMLLEPGTPAGCQLLAAIRSNIGLQAASRS